MDPKIVKNTEKILKQIFDFYQDICEKYSKIIVRPVPTLDLEFEVHMEFSLDLSCSEEPLYYSSNKFKIKSISNDLKKLENILELYLLDSFADNYRFSEHEKLNKKLSGYCSKFDERLLPYMFINRDIYSNDKFQYILDSLNNYISKLENESKKVSVKLNNSYDAEYVEGSDHVVVGCQKIPVKAIKELYSKLK